MAIDPTGVAALLRLLAEGKPAVWVSVAQASGSVPREPGAAMVVAADACHGTIGGGHLEYEAIGTARQALREGTAGAAWLVRFPLAARLGQCCGGVATLAYAMVTAADARWLGASAALAEANTGHAIVVQLGAPGARCVVTPDGIDDPPGAAMLDEAATAEVRKRLAAGRTGVIEPGGRPLLVHVVRPDPFPVLLFGNGHVARALVATLGTLPAQVRWIDSRAGDFPATVPANVEVVVTDAPEDEIASAPAGAYVLVMTHSHALDFDLVAAALGRGDWRYLGLIGSKSKRAQFERRLAQRGIAGDSLARVTCPIGAGGPRGKEPGVVAVAVAAELLMVREALAARREIRAQLAGA